MLDDEWLGALIKKLEEEIRKAMKKKKYASEDMVQRVEDCICSKFTKPELVNPSRVEGRCGIDHHQAEEALETISPDPGKPGLWKICDEKHDLIKSSTRPKEWWYACDYSIMTHISKYFEERIREDFGKEIPPLSELSKGLDSALQKFDQVLKSLDYWLTR